MPKPTRLCLRAVEFRAGEAMQGGDGRTLEGYAAVFNEVTEINSWEGTFQEELAKGAFRKTLKERTPVMQFDHGHDARTGTIPIGAFSELREDDEGLYVQARLFDNPNVEPVRQAIEGGAITGMSFRFQVMRDEWRDKDGKLVKPAELEELLWMPGDRGPLKRTIKEVQLFEAGPVVFPAYEATSVGVRASLAELSEEERTRLLSELVEDAKRTSMTEEEETVETVEEVTTEERDEELPSENADGTPAPTTTVTPETATTPVVPKARKERAMNEQQMTVEERVARQETIRARLSEIDTEYNGATLPEEIQTEWDSLNTEHDEHDDAVEAASLRAEQLQRLAVDDRRMGRQTERAGATSRNAPQRRRPDNIYDVNEIRNQARSADEVAGLYRENAMRAVDVARFSGVVGKEDAQENIERLLNNVDDEHGTLARRILVTGSPTYERAWSKALHSLNTNGLTAEETRALSLGSDANGGYAVPFQLDPTVILTSDGVINPLRSMARVVQITGKKWQGVATSGVTVTRSAEASEIQPNSPTFTQPEVNATRVTGFVQFSVELEATWGEMRQEITNILNDAKETEEAESFVNGDGVTAYQPYGVVKTLDAASHVPDGAAFGSADVYALEEALPPRYRQRAQFLGNKASYNAVRQLAAGSDGSDLWVRLGDGRPNSLIGYPAKECSVMGNVGDAGGYLLFGDFQNFIIVDRIGMSVELVPHLFSSNGLPTGQRGILAIWANGSKILVHNAFRLLDGAAS